MNTAQFKQLTKNFVDPLTGAFINYGCMYLPLTYSPVRIKYHTSLQFNKQLLCEFILYRAKTAVRGHQPVARHRQILAPHQCKWAILCIYL